MTFDEWFATTRYAECHKELIRLGWAGAVKTLTAKPKSVPPEPQVGDHWVIRVKGGRLTSRIEVVHIDEHEIWIKDAWRPHKYSANQRKRRLEDLEFMTLLHRSK